MNKLVTLLLSLALVSSAFAETQGSVPVRIGAIITLTGDFAFSGAAIQRGAAMRLREDPNKIQFLFEDDRTNDRKMVVSAFRKLVDIDQVPLLFTTTAPAMEPIAPLVTSARIPTVAVWDYNESIHRPEQYRYSMGFSNERAGMAMASLAREKLNVSRVAVITAHDEWSEVMSKAFAEQTTRLGGSIDDLGRIDLNESNVRGLILRAKKLQSPALFFPLYLTSFSSVVRQARELKYTGALLTGEGLTEAEARSLGSSADKIFFQRIWVGDPAFQKKYAAFFGETRLPADIGFVGIGYDMASLAIELVDSCVQAKEPVDSENLQRRLRTKKFVGVTGAVDFAQFTGKTLATLQNDNGRIIEVED